MSRGTRVTSCPLCYREQDVTLVPLWCNTLGAWLFIKMNARNKKSKNAAYKNRKNKLAAEQILLDTT